MAPRAHAGTPLQDNGMRPNYDAPLCITMGDPSGVGIEVALKSWKQRNTHDLPAIYLIADRAEVEQQNRALGLAVTLYPIDNAAQLESCPDNALPVFDCAGDDSARSTIQSIELAAQHCRSGSAAGMVTMPINKHKLYASGFSHPGHTEFLGALCGTATPPIMMLAIPGLRVVLSTIHIPLRDVASNLEQLGTAGLTNLAQNVLAALQADFGIAAPRLAIAGLNPHAGEAGSIGDEELTLINPAVAELQSRGHNVVGPLPADTLFHDAARRSYDAILCHYHDQALIPLKTLNFHQGVNVTLGLPIVRTSPDHGTAEDIAGTGTADPRSAIAAIKMAQDIAKARNRVQAS